MNSTHKVLTSYHVPYSLPDHPGALPELVTDSIRKYGAEAWRVMDGGGIVYLCGASGGFASACAAALRDVVREHGNMSEAEAAEYFSRLLTDKAHRYREDVFG